MSDTQLEKSACDGQLRPKGVGYKPPSGSYSILYSLPNSGGVEGRHLMDLSAHPFGTGPGGTLDYEAALRRYGPNFHGVDAEKPRFLAIDFESIYQKGGRYLTKLACDNKFGTASTLSCYPTNEELHDYYAVNPGEARRAAQFSSDGEDISDNSSTGQTPSQPAVTDTTYNSTENSLSVSWRTRKGHTSFIVKVNELVKKVEVKDVNATNFNTTVILPRDFARKLVVTVTAFIGEVAGKESMAKVLDIEPTNTSTDDNTNTNPTNSTDNNTNTLEEQIDRLTEKNENLESELVAAILERDKALSDIAKLTSSSQHFNPPSQGIIDTINKVLPNIKVGRVIQVTKVLEQRFSNLHNWLVNEVLKNK